MSPQDAAGLWKQYLEPLHDNGYTLISPACTNAPSGKTWMQDFFKACDGCHVCFFYIRLLQNSLRDCFNRSIVWRYTSTGLMRRILLTTSKTCMPPSANRFGLPSLPAKTSLVVNKVISNRSLNSCRKSLRTWITLIKSANTSRLVSIILELENSYGC